MMHLKSMSILMLIIISISFGCSSCATDELDNDADSGRTGDQDMGITTDEDSSSNTADTDSTNTVNGQKYITASIDYCIMKPKKVISNLKFIFVVDKSGSNQDSPDLGLRGTDVDGSRRYRPIIQYLNDAPNDPTVFYSLVNFATESNIVSEFTNVKEDFSATVQTESNPTGVTPPRPSDGGWTNFERALANVDKLIKDDISDARDQEAITHKTVSSYYVVIFISDGAPWISETERQSENDIRNLIAGIVKENEQVSDFVESVNIHTGYYYGKSPDQQARDYMNIIANNGNGASYEFASGQVIDFSQFSIPERNIKHQIKDLIVTNANTVYYRDTLYYDSDADGISNVVEETLGSNPYLADSDGNGVSDGVEYYAFDKPCHDATCIPKNAKKYDECKKYEIAGLKQSDDSSAVPVRRMTDFDKDFLNDCEEEFVLRSKNKDFDSNRDWIPDSLAYRHSYDLLELKGDASTRREGVAISPMLDPDSDGSNNYTEIRENTPRLYDNDKITGLLPYNYSQIRTSNDCYHMEVKDIAVMSENDLIRVYLMESTSVVQNKRFLRAAEKRVIPGKDKVIFTKEDFIE